MSTFSQPPLHKTLPLSSFLILPRPIMVKCVAPLAFLAFTTADPFNWKPCPGSTDPHLQCGVFTVPLNHLNPTKNNQTIDLAVRRYLTNSTSSKGTIVMNPGGPGASGTYLASAKSIVLTGGNYDVFGFDPRGVGESRPIKCSKNGVTAATEAARLASLTVPLDTESSPTSIDRYEAELKAQVRRCEVYDGDYLPYLSTAFVARDMDLIRKALGESVLNYYGISYGTFLGVTYANMFPDHVGRMALDSILDPVAYTGPTPEVMLASVAVLDTVFDAFVSACEEAGPSLCALAEATGKPSGYVCDKVQALFDATNETPLIVPTKDGDVSVLTGTDIRSRTQSGLSFPQSFPQVAKYLSDLINGTFVANGVKDAPTFCSADANRALNLKFPLYIANDGDNTGDHMSWEDMLQASKDQSANFGIMYVKDGWGGMLFKPKPVERYAGPWDKSLKNRILLLNNEVDPQTPLEWAQNTADIMGDNAVLVIREGYGHTVTNLPSKCIQQITIDFFNNGTYPDPDTTCPLDTGLFGLQRHLNESEDDVEAARNAFAQLMAEQRGF
ncbi:Aste57867_1603 [Aphanomyces stellatus]|uniref:Aste57867_1603 protein n=1 Tax=Aphanomyces stellatus TaxID=120398 RepID=A0A485K6N6_9STRA|nr:hypothetical protein As57867_001602 [Aphanomyces stellatus]VFT78816.1 Aste57867_1603 [Aphanomyces stellatus]